MLPMIDHQHHHQLHDNGLPNSTQMFAFSSKSSHPKRRHTNKPVVYGGLPRDLTKFLKENHSAPEHWKPYKSVEYFSQEGNAEQRLLQVAVEDGPYQSFRRGKTMLEFRTAVHRDLMPSKYLKKGTGKSGAPSGDGNGLRENHNGLNGLNDHSKNKESEQISEPNNEEFKDSTYQQIILDMQRHMAEMSRNWNREKQQLTSALNTLQANCQQYQTLASEAVGHLEKAVYVLDALQDKTLEPSSTTSVKLSELDFVSIHQCVEKTNQMLGRNPSDWFVNVGLKKEEAKKKVLEPPHEEQRQEHGNLGAQSASGAQYLAAYNLLVQLKTQILELPYGMASPERESLQSYEVKIFHSTASEVDRVMDESITLLRRIMAYLDVVAGNVSISNDQALRQSKEESGRLQCILEAIKNQHNVLNDFIKATTEKRETKIEDLRQQLEALRGNVNQLQAEMAAVQLTISRESTENLESTGRKPPSPVATSLYAQQQSNFRMEPVYQQPATPVDNPILWFSQRQFMRNAATLKRALIEKRVSAMAYKEALKKMEEYCQVPAERLATLVRKYLSMKSMQFIAEYVRSNRPLNDRVFRMLDKVEQITVKRECRYKDIMKYWEAERIRRAQRVVEVCESIEDCASLFLVKPTVNKYSREWLMRQTLEEGKEPWSRQKTNFSLPTQLTQIVNSSKPKTPNQPLEKPVNDKVDTKPSTTIINNDEMWNSELATQAVNCELDGTSKLLELDISRTVWQQTMASAAIFPVVPKLAGRGTESAALFSTTYPEITSPKSKRLPSLGSELHKSSQFMSQTSMVDPPRLQRESTFLSLPSSDAQSYLIVQRTLSKGKERPDTTKTWSGLESVPYSPNFPQENTRAVSFEKPTRGEVALHTDDEESVYMDSPSPLQGGMISSIAPNKGLVSGNTNINEGHSEVDGSIAGAHLAHQEESNEKQTS